VSPRGIKQGGIDGPLRFRMRKPELRLRGRALGIQSCRAEFRSRAAPPTEEQRALITGGLTPEERDVLLHHGTEAPFGGVFLDNHEEGIYTCRFCG